MEQFTVYHYKKVKPRNTLEEVVIHFVEKNYSCPVEQTIEQVKENVDACIQHYSKSLHQIGVKTSDIRVFGTYVGHPNHVERSFSLYGRGRGTSTLTIKETVTKDADNNYSPVVKNKK